MMLINATRNSLRFGRAGPLIDLHRRYNIVDGKGSSPDSHIYQPW